jgi:ABC-type transporter Mla subunit MlaD
MVAQQVRVLLNTIRAFFQILIDKLDVNSTYNHQSSDEIFQLLSISSANLVEWLSPA